jgi:hypothetical protein
LAYEYSDNKLNELDFLVYPLSSNGCLFAFAIKDNKKSSINITTEFVDEIKLDIATKEPFAFVYDNNSCYIYTSKNFKKIYKNVNIDNRKRWSSSAGSHATVIDGINVIAGYITIMNPASGFMSASANGSSYTYISLNSGNTFTLYAYAN